MVAKNLINMKLKEEGIPSISSPNTDDLFGPTMNVYAKKDKLWLIQMEW